MELQEVYNLIASLIKSYSTNCLFLINYVLKLVNHQELLQHWIAIRNRNQGGVRNPPLSLSLYIYIYIYIYIVFSEKSIYIIP
jgi:hypothetical protein